MNKEELHELNETILLNEKHVLEATKTISEGRLRCESETLMMLKEIAEEVDDNGKLRFSNDVKRKAELDRRLNDGHSLKTVSKQLDDDSHSTKLQKLEINFLKRQLDIELQS